MRKYFKRILMGFLLLSIRVNTVSAAPYPQWFLTNAQEAIAGFVASNPEIDYTRFRVDGNTSGTWLTIVSFAASRGYIDVLIALEEYSAITDYVVRNGMLNPLELALGSKSTEAVAHLAGVRGDWVHSSSYLAGSGGVADLAIATSGDMTLLAGGTYEPDPEVYIPMLDILFSAGLDVNAQAPQTGRTLMDRASGYSLLAFEYVRGRGGLFTGDARFPRLVQDKREALISKYLEHAFLVYKDRIQFPDGTVIEYNMQGHPPYAWPNYAPLSAADQDVLDLAIRETGEQCNNIVVLLYHDHAGQALRYYVEPIIWEHKLLGLYKSAPGVDYKYMRDALYPTLEESYQP